VADLRERGEIEHHKGYIPKSLESLVGSSTIIVKGRFGNLLENRYFFGYVEGRDDTLEEFMERHDFTATEAYNWDIPMSEYEIIIDEVLKGDLESEIVVLRKYEAPPIDRTFTHPDVDRIFFLVKNPDNRTYAVGGEASILNLVDGEYSYYAYVEQERSSSANYEVKNLSFASERAETFEEDLVGEISKQEKSPVEQ